MSGDSGSARSIAEMLGQVDERIPLYIDGERVWPSHGDTFDVMNPAVGEVLAKVCAANADDVDLAVRAAEAALKRADWRELDAGARARVLWRLADLLDENAEELGRIETLNNGKTLSESVGGDVPASASLFRYYAGYCDKLLGETIPVAGGHLCYTLKQPVGVCGQIVPWNYPLMMAAWKVAPALAAGCTIVLKPSELTPLTAVRLGELCVEAGVPAGVVNVVPGLGGVAGDALARHHGVQKLAFTGSVRTARSLLHASADSNLKRLSLELGGKSPLVVLDDADLDEVVEAAFWGIFANKGEVCCASSRLIAAKSVKDELVERLAERARAMKVGDPMDPDMEMGAQVSLPQLERVLGFIERARADGARVAAGGERKTEGALSQGYFVEPTIFDKVTPDMEIACDEVFGPVLAVLEAGSDEEAVAIANSTTYGLASAVFTRDVSRAHRVARDIDAGVVWVNMWDGFDDAAPFGGTRESGWGREMGRYGIEMYTETKTVWVKL